MSKVTDKASETVEATPQVKVVETPAAELEIKNPHLTVRVEIAGLENHTSTGIRNSVLKLTRGWIRQRGVTVQLPGTVVTDVPGGGEEVEVDGVNVTADLRVYAFDAKCLTDNNVTVNEPQPRGRTADTTPKVELTPEEKAALKETKRVAAAAKRAEKKAALQAEKDVTPPPVVETPAATGEEKPNDW